ncbi:MAG: hypothetical protein LUC51_09745 [Cloacibacillus porcorum]|nr:hypothetical protein [Cloacibacillus porcorum]
MAGANAVASGLRGDVGGALSNGASALGGREIIGRAKADPVKIGLSNENVAQNALKAEPDPTGRSQFPSRYDDYMKYLGRNADWTDTDQIKYDNLLKRYGLYRR